MDANDILHEIFGRLPQLVRDAVVGLDGDQLTQAPAPGANSIGWLIWHLTRVQDGHIAELLEQDQVWVSGDWAEGFGLAPDPANTGYGHEPDDMAAVRPRSPDALVGYYDAVASRTGSYLATLVPADFDAVIDDSWDPPVTLGARLVSVADDDLQHAGQASYVRGLLERGGRPEAACAICCEINRRSPQRPGSRSRDTQAAGWARSRPAG